MWFQRAWYRMIWAIFEVSFNLLCRVQTEVASNVPEKGPFIIACNHLHLFDPPLVLVAVPFHQIIVLAAEKWGETWPINWLLKSVGAIFVRRGEVDPGGIKCDLVVPITFTLEASFLFQNIFLEA